MLTLTLKLFKNQANNSVTIKLMPIIESFFMTVKILMDYEQDLE